MFTVMIFIIAAPILLIELFYVIISGLIEERKHKNNDEDSKTIHDIRTETNDEESARIDYWGTDDEWNNKWGKL